MYKIFDKMKKHKKGQIQSALYALLVLGLFLVVVGYILAFGSDFIQQRQATYTSGSYAFNASAQTLSAMTTVAQGQGTVSTVGILVIVVGLLVGVIAALGFAGQRRENF